MRKLRLEITLHDISRYKQRVEDDPNRYELTDGQISRRIRKSLSYIEDIEMLPRLGDYHVGEAHFPVRGGLTRSYFCVLARDRLKIKEWRVITILTQEMYGQGLTS